MIMFCFVNFPARCLIRRGADVNQEDHNGMRPDDLSGLPSVDDCREMIQFNRAQRQEMLSDLVRNVSLLVCTESYFAKSCYETK